MTSLVILNIEKERESWEPNNKLGNCPTFFFFQKERKRERDKENNIEHLVQWSLLFLIVDRQQFRKKSEILLIIYRVAILWRTFYFCQSGPTPNKWEAISYFNNCYCQGRRLLILDSHLAIQFAPTCYIRSLQQNQTENTTNDCNKADRSD